MNMCLQQLQHTTTEPTADLTSGTSEPLYIYEIEKRLPLLWEPKILSKILKCHKLSLLSFTYKIIHLLFSS